MLLPSFCWKEYLLYYVMTPNVYAHTVRVGFCLITYLNETSTETTIIVVLIYRVLDVENAAKGAGFLRKATGHAENNRIIVSLEVENTTRGKWELQEKF